MEAQTNPTSLQNTAQKEKLVLFNHFYEKLVFFSTRVVVLRELVSLQQNEQMNSTWAHFKEQTELFKS